MTPDQIVSAAQERGSNARDIRDAVHESLHGLDTDAIDKATTAFLWTLAILVLWKTTYLWLTSF